MLLERVSSNDISSSSSINYTFLELKSNLCSQNGSIGLDKIAFSKMVLKHSDTPMSYLAEVSTYVTSSLSAKCYASSFEITLS